MADIELVIKVSEELYNRFGHEYSDENLISKYTNDAILDAFCNGIPLPKGHGDLVDRDDLLADSYHIDDWSGNEINIVDVMTVKMADAIIEADTESEDKE